MYNNIKVGLNIKNTLTKISSIIPLKIRFFLRLPILIYYKLNNLLILFRLKIKVWNGNQIKVAFFAENVSMWKYDGLFKLMRESNYFSPIAVIAPPLYESREEKLRNRKELIIFFNNKKINYIDLYSNKDYNLDISVNFDIVFYPQPYEGYLPYKYSYRGFTSSIYFYIPYAMRSTGSKWGYNTNLTNIAYKCFYETNFHKMLARKYCFFKDNNVVVTGSTVYDKFLDKNYKPTNIWKKQEKLKKKVIWAPHHSILNNDPLDYSSFLKIYNIMPKLAEKYSDRIQFCFKPHPLLKTKLYKLWGKDKTDEYYKLWEKMPNTQYENGEYIDLFMTSDAMIHDCDSFRFEYLITEKPVAYMKKDKYKNEPVGISKTAFNLHYNTNSKEKIEDYLENVVLKGNDQLKEKRIEFKQKYLIPPNGKTASENIYDEICKELGIVVNG